MSRLLLIDEDSGNRLVLRSQLVDAGHEVVALESGARGLAEARTSPFDAILVSARMSKGIDGFETAHRLKAVPECGATPVLMYTETHSTQDDLVRAYESGADLYLNKDELESLPKILHAQLRHRQRCLELARHVRSLQDALKRATGGDTAAREGLENGGIDPATILKELATGRPDGVILVDDDGLVRYADRGACEIFGQRIDSMPLGTLAPSSGLEAFVRDVRTEPRVGFRFDLPARGSRGTRSLSAVAVPLLVRPGGPTNHVATRLLVLQDATRRRYAAERLKISDTVLNGRESSVLLDAARVLWRPEALPGRSAAVVAVRNTVVATAAQAAPVLITGPNGGEQDLVARIVHYTSPRTGPYISQRCGAMAPEHALAEVFGCAAPVARQGLLQHVVDGTLHLADIGELPQAVQERLANWLESGQIMRVGATKPERLDARLIVSCEGNPEDLAKAGRLHPRLLELLEAQTIALVPLESRREDIEDLARSFVVKHGAARGVTSLDGGALAILRARNWPNDVRELEEVVRSACNAASTPVITADELPRTMRDLGANGRSAVGRGVVTAPLPVSLPMATTGASGWGGTYARGELTPAPRASTGHRPARDWDITEDEPVSLDLYEKKALLRALDECGGDRLAAAKLLKVGKSTLYRKLKRFDIT